MIIENIPAEITRIKKSSKDEMKLFLVITFIAAALPFTFGFLFFYIEHCYDPQPVVLAASEVKHEQLCSELRKQLQPLAGNSSIINGTSMKFLNNSKFNNSANTTYTNINNSNSTNVTNNNNNTESNNNNSNNNNSFDISDLVKRFCNPPAKPIRNNCKLDIRNIAQWLSYTSSVAYTFGKNAKKNPARFSNNLLLDFQTIANESDSWKCTLDYFKKNEKSYTFFHIRIT